MNITSRLLAFVLLTWSFAHGGDRPEDSNPAIIKIDGEPASIAGPNATVDSHPGQTRTSSTSGNTARAFEEHFVSFMMKIRGDYEDGHSPFRASSQLDLEAEGFYDLSIKVFRLVADHERVRSRHMCERLRSDLSHGVPRAEAIESAIDYYESREVRLQEFTQIVREITNDIRRSMGDDVFEAFVNEFEAYAQSGGGTMSSGPFFRQDSEQFIQRRC